MITSVTSATISATSALADFAIGLGAGSAILLILLAIASQLLHASAYPRLQAARDVLRVTSGPLLIVFATSVAARIFAILAVPT